MSVTITQYLPEHECAVQRFNDRMRETGMGLCERSTATWLPGGNGTELWQEQFIAVDAQSAIRGGYTLKHQEFLIRNQKHVLSDWQYPLSESVINQNYALLGLQLYRHAYSRQPLLFGLGVGDSNRPVRKLFKHMKWNFVPVPFFFHICRAGAVFRNIRVLQTTRLKRVTSRFVAAIGLAALATRVIQSRARHLPRSATYELVDSFGSWADDLWEACGTQYELIAVRNCKVLNRLYPRVRVMVGKGQSKPGEFQRIKVLSEGRVVGWAVVVTSDMENHKHFGNLRVGSIVDSFASPQDAWLVILAARQLLSTQQVDLIVSNHLHHAWSTALRACGFLSGPTNFNFAISPQLADLLDPIKGNGREFFLNRGDGDGPINL